MSQAVAVAVVVAVAPAPTSTPAPDHALSTPQPARLPPRTPLQRFALATVPESLAHEPARVPNPLPRMCAYNNFRCVNQLRFRLDEGWVCRGHFELFWEMGHVVQEHRVVRL